MVRVIRGKVVGRVPRIKLRGVVASPAGLYDGQYLTSCAHWWNELLQSDKAIAKQGFPAFDAQRTSHLVAVPKQENRELFQAVAQSIAMPGTLPVSALNLAYAFAVTVEAGAFEESFDDPSAVSWLIGHVLTVDDVEQFSKHYEIIADDVGLEPLPPFWYHIENYTGSVLCNVAARSIRWAFEDQVKRWGEAEGLPLHMSIGAPDYALMSVEDPESRGRLPSFVDLLFEWGGRLRLFEQHDGSS